MLLLPTFWSGSLERSDLDPVHARNPGLPRYRPPFQYLFYETIVVRPDFFRNYVILGNYRWQPPRLNGTTMVHLNSKNRKTLEALFEAPTRSDVRWTDFEALLASLGAVISEGRGSRVRVLLNKCEAVFHRPHPRPEMNKGAVASAREFLRRAGSEP
jgi:hypothetical protein